MKSSPVNEKPCIQLDLLSEDTVCITKEVNTDHTIWSEVTTWWDQNCNNVRLSEDTIEIPIIDFLRRINWLKTYWLDEDRTYVSSTQLKRSIQNRREQGKKFTELLRNTSEPDNTDLTCLRLKRTPRSFQKDNVNRLLRMPSGANFSVPGAGKTSTTLMIWSMLRIKKLVNKLLVIAPRSAFSAWRDDNYATFSTPFNTSIFGNNDIELSADILIVNYEQLQTHEKAKRLATWVEKNDAMVAIDEAHRIKGGTKSIRWNRVREITTKAKRIDLLTGTPMPQGFDDLKNLYSIAWPSVTFHDFSDSLLRSAQRGGIYVRTTKAELELPPVTLKEINIEMGDIQSEVYSALKKRYAGTFQLNFDNESFMKQKGRAVLTLIAVATNPGLMSGIRTEDSYLGLEWPPREFGIDSDLLDLVSNYASHEISPKYEWVARYIKKASNEKRKVLVWTNFVGSILALQKLLEPFNPAVVFGKLSGEDREREIERFKNKSNCHVLITNPQTLGEGVSLHHWCHEAIYVDRIYNAGLYLQSVDRIHRLGLPKDQETKIFILNSERSVDDSVSVSLNKKIERMSEALDDPGLIESTIPEELEDISPSELLGLEKFDLDDLYEHLANE